MFLCGESTKTLWLSCLESAIAWAMSGLNWRMSESETESTTRRLFLGVDASLICTRTSDLWGDDEGTGVKLRRVCLLRLSNLLEDMMT